MIKWGSLRWEFRDCKHCGRIRAQLMLQDSASSKRAVPLDESFYSPADERLMLKSSVHQPFGAMLNLETHWTPTVVLIFISNNFSLCFNIKSAQLKLVLMFLAECFAEMRCEVCTRYSYHENPHDHAVRSKGWCVQKVCVQIFPICTCRGKEWNFNGYKLGLGWWKPQQSVCRGKGKNLAYVGNSGSWIC